MRIDKNLSSTPQRRLRHQAQRGVQVGGGLRVTGQNGGSGGCTGPARQADVAIAATNALNVALPPQSITVLVLKPWSKRTRPQAPAARHAS